MMHDYCMNVVFAKIVYGSMPRDEPNTLISYGAIITN